jgi:DNA-binding response OmpR family regulator
MEPARILIVDDDPVLVHVVDIALRSAGYETCAAHDGNGGLRCLYEMQPDLVLLDVMMPGHDGWEVCRRIREMTDVPIIMLTAKRELSHRLRGLNLGADDYVPKPFDMDELLLRVQAVLRRAALAQTPAPMHYDDGILCIDEASSRVTKRGQPIRLTAKEMELLLTLLRRANEIVPVDELASILWSNNTKDAKYSLRVHINSLRHKIEDNPQVPKYIITRRGVGYGFQSQQDTPS